MIRVTLIALLCASCAIAHPQIKSEKETATIPPNTPIVTPGPTQNLYFVVSSKNLPSKDANSGLVDPYVNVFYGIIPPDVKKQGTDLDALGVSETINDEANPKWVKVFKVQYTKGTYQKLYVEVHDHDPLNPDDVVGDAYIDLDEYVANGQYLTAPLSSKSGSVVITKTTPFLFTLAVKNVPALDEFGGLSDPFVKCYFRYGKEGKDVKFYETNTVDNVETASWEQPISFDNYQKGTNQFFHFKVRDHDAITGNDDIGESFLEIDPFVEKKMSSVLPLSKTTNATLIVKYTL